MPTISTFYGIRVFMRQILKEHNPPHIHAQYGGYQASFTIADGNLYQGEFPKRAAEMVKEFVSKNKEELLKMWESGQYKKLKGID